MRKLLSILALSVFVLLVVVPAVYLQYAAEMPDLSGEEAVFKAVSRRIETQRVADQGVGTRYDHEKFAVVPLEKIPKGLVAAVLAEYGCPDYFEGRKLAGGELYKRLLNRARSVSGRAGPERCQIAFADVVAQTLELRDPIPAAIADRHVVESLSVQRLFEYRVSMMQFAPGVLGPRDGARKLFGKELERLDLNESAELMAAERYWDAIHGCTNAVKAKMFRDDVLDRMAEVGTITRSQGVAAKSRPVTCNLRPR